jgi:hypothetical protein
MVNFLYGATLILLLFDFADCWLPCRRPGCLDLGGNRSSFLTRLRHLNQTTCGLPVYVTVSNTTADLLSGWLPPHKPWVILCGFGQNERQNLLT